MSFDCKLKHGEYFLYKHELGYYEISNKPTEEELDNFYSNLLYQDPEKSTSSYSINYSNDEVEYIENKSRKIYNVVKDSPTKKLLDVGCGEGYVSRYFLDLQYEVKCLDYSSYGVETHNSSVLEYFIKGDVFKNLDTIIANREKYGIVILNNVIEHVLDPIKILNKIKVLLDKDGILVITAPNDFSNLQSYLLKNEHISEMNWVAPPMHLSYFTLTSLSNLVKYCGYSIYNYYAEYPIDFDLLVNHTNYVNNKDIGKDSHLKRLRVDNFLCSQSISNTNKYYKCLADLNAGRDIVMFVK